MSERIVVEMEDGSIAVVCPGFKSMNPPVLYTCAEVLALNTGSAIPKGAKQFKVVPAEACNGDRVFRNAWVWDESHEARMRESVTKSKEITHDRRRAKRTEEFTPLDVQATIPDQAVAAETARVAVRTRYDDMQISIDACTTPEELKAIISTEGI